MYLEELASRFREEQNKDQVKAMEKYMKNQFSFLGIKTPERKEILKNFYKDTNILNEASLPESLIKELWALPEREYQYAAINLLLRRPKWLNKEYVPLLQQLITTKSWWDTVDAIATNVIGPLFMKEPGLVEEYIEDWKLHENLWLRRTAILYQLKYKEKTNVDRLFHIIQLNQEDKDFFIRKAIGWALREYSKTDPLVVEQFIKTASLSKLSIREGMKHINREKIK